MEMFIYENLFSVSDMTLDLIIARGNLKQALAQLDSATVLHSAEIMRERRTNEEVRRGFWTVGFWTADFPLYAVEGGEAVLYVGNRDNNLVFKNFGEAFEQLMSTGNYRPGLEEAEKVMKAETTLKVAISDLKLAADNDEYGHFEIKTEQPLLNLNLTQKALVERVHSSGKDLSLNMQMLNNAGIKETRGYTLTSDYVKKHAKESPFARVCWLSGFYDDSNFSALNRLFGGDIGALLGARR